MSNYVNEFGVTPGGENEILNAVIHFYTKDESLQYDLERIYKRHRDHTGEFFYPPNAKEGWSNDNHYAIHGMKRLFNVNVEKSRNSGHPRQVWRKRWNDFLLVTGLWRLTGIITCMRGKEGTSIRTSGVRILWLICMFTNSKKSLKFFSWLLKMFHPLKTFHAVFAYYYRNENHPIVKGLK
jgi:hypothetical protein